MKKNYIIPALELIDADAQQMLCSSGAIEINGEDLTTTLDATSGDFGSEDIVNANILLFD